MTIEQNLQTVRDTWNEKWQQHLAKHEDFLSSLPAYFSDFFRNMTLFAATGDRETIYLTVHVNEQAYECTQWKWESDEWYISILRRASQRFLDNKTPRANEINAFLNDFSFSRFRTAYRKPKEEEMLAELRTKFIGKEITNVIDDGEVIRIEVDHQTCYPYNDMFEIGDYRHCLDERGEKEN